MFNFNIFDFFWQIINIVLLVLIIVLIIRYVRKRTGK